MHPFPRGMSQRAAQAARLFAPGLWSGVRRAAPGDRFALDAGVDRRADLYRRVLRYPEARSGELPLNPKACWDGWVYTGPDYDTRRGPRLRWLEPAMAAPGAPLE